MPPKMGVNMSTIRNLRDQRPLSRDQLKTQLADAKIRLSEIDGELASRKSQRNSATFVFIVGLFLVPALGLGVIVAIFAFVRYFQHKAVINDMEEERAGVVRKIARLETELMG
jgi:hypothetical protein